MARSRIVRVGEAQEVHLEETDVGDRPHGELRGRRGVLVVGCGPLQRYVVGQRVLRYDDTGGVGRRMPDGAFEVESGVDDLPARVVGVAQAGEFGVLTERVGERYAEAGGDQPGEPVSGGIAEVEGAGYVAKGGSRAEGAEGDDLRHVIPAVAFDAVADHLFPAVVLEVHVDVGHLLALDIEEPFEDQAVLQPG